MVGGLVNPGFRHNLSGQMRTPYSKQGILEISHELPGGVAISASYLYVHALKIGTVTGILNGVQTGTLPSGKPVSAPTAPMPASASTPAQAAISPRRGTVNLAFIKLAPIEGMVGSLANKGQSASP